MKTTRILLAALAGLSACSNPAEQKADDLLSFSERNSVISDDTWRGIAKLVCRPQSLEICGSVECRKADITPDTFVVWEPNGTLFQRCDRVGCDTYEPVVTRSGHFANVVLPESGNVFRVSSSGEYREMAHLATDTYFYRGQCKATD